MATSTIKQQNTTFSLEVSTLGTYQQIAANTWEKTGLKITVPSSHVYVGNIVSGWSGNGRPIGIGVNGSESMAGGMPTQSNENENGVYSVTVFLHPGTWWLFTKRDAVGTAANTYTFRYIDLELR